MWSDQGADAKSNFSSTRVIFKTVYPAVVPCDFHSLRGFFPSKRSNCWRQVGFAPGDGRQGSGEGWDGPEHHLLCGSCRGLSEMGRAGEKGESSPANILKVIHGAKRDSPRSQDWWQPGGARGVGCKGGSRGSRQKGWGPLKRREHSWGMLGGMHGDHQRDAIQQPAPGCLLPPWHSVSRAGKESRWRSIYEELVPSPRSTRKQPGPGANNLVTLSLQLRGVTRLFDLRAAWSKTNKLSCLFREKSAKPRALEETSLLLLRGTDSPPAPVPRRGAGTGRAGRRKPRSLSVSTVGAPSPNTGVLLLLSGGS